MVMGRKRIHKKTKPEPGGLVLKVREFTSKGRAFVWLIYDNGERYCTTKARWVMGLPPKEFRVVHLNRNATDCRRENLKLIPNEVYGKRKAVTLEPFRYTKFIRNTINQDKSQLDWS